MPCEEYESVVIKFVNYVSSAMDSPLILITELNNSSWHV